MHRIGYIYSCSEKKAKDLAYIVVLRRLRRLRGDPPRATPGGGRRQDAVRPAQAWHSPARLGLWLGSAFFSTGTWPLQLLLITVMRLSLNENVLKVSLL